VITYVTGDATRPTGDAPKLIAHVCNDMGGWGRGFVVALSQRDKTPEMMYRMWSEIPTMSWHGDGAFALGNVQFAAFGDGDTTVANMIAQHGVARGVFPPPIRYEALRKCLRKVAEHAVSSGASVHMPRIGCGLAGGRWSEVEPMIAETVCSRGIHVTVYDLPGKPFRETTGARSE